MTVSPLELSRVPAAGSGASGCHSHFPLLVGGECGGNAEVMEQFFPQLMPGVLLPKPLLALTSSSSLATALRGRQPVWALASPGREMGR